MQSECGFHRFLFVWFCKATTLKRRQRKGKDGKEKESNGEELNGMERREKKENGKF